MNQLVPFTGRHIVVNLKESVRQWVLRELPYDRADADLVAHLNSLDAHGLLVVYHNWMSRLIKPQPRQVRKSNAFRQNPLTAARANELAQIIDDIESGRDLRKYLSRGVKVAASIPGKPFGKRRDLDLMLNAQGTHHLHISTQVEADGYVSRPKQGTAPEPLLFAVFQQQTAYLIDIMKHGDWTRDHVLKVLATEWPDEGLIHEVKGGKGFKVIGPRHNYTEDERGLLQMNGINTPVQIGHNVFMPAGGMTSAAGTTMAAGRESG
jgi:hypothetical protein